MTPHRKMSSNKLLERTVIRLHMRAASAPFHYALTARFTQQRAAAQLRRYAAWDAHQRGNALRARHVDAVSCHCRVIGGKMSWVAARVALRLNGL
jgi:hypothetical protein